MPYPSAPLALFCRPAQWVVLLMASATFAALFRLIGLPAALMLGPMIAAVLVGTAGGTIRVHHHAQNAAQVVIGCMVAGLFTAAIVGTVWREWPLCLAVVLSTVAASGGLGWVVGRSRVLPGSTAVWGLSPGAASIMMLMAEEFGADGRHVAFMQYLRVVCVATVAAVVARVVVDPSGVAAVRVGGPPAVYWLPSAETVAVAGFGVAFGYLSRMPAGLLLGPMVVGAVLHAAGAVEIDLPPWLLAASYIVVGWRIGLAFTRPVVAHAARALPQTLLSIVALIAFCGGLSGILVVALGVDPLTAYLATSPGGVDSAAIIGASGGVDLSFVMALQTIRLVVVLLLGPSVARFVARRLQRREVGLQKAADDFRTGAAIGGDKAMVS